MENSYGIGITNRFASFIDDDEVGDPADILKQLQNAKDAKKIAAAAAKPAQPAKAPVKKEAKKLEIMAEEGASRGGFGRGRGDRGRGDRGRGRGARRGGGDKEEWVPFTKLGRLVKEGKVTSLEEIFLFSLPVKEYQIVDHFLGSKLNDEVMKVMPVQKQTTAGQRTRFKAFVAVGDNNGHCGLGVKCAKEVATAIRGAIIAAKMACVPIRRGYWGKMVGLPHTVPMKVTGKCGSVRVRLIPAPRGTGLVASPVPKKLLGMAGIEDVYTASNGHTRTMGNFLKAVFAAMSKTYGYLTPEMWSPTVFTKTPYQEHTDFLALTQKN